MGKDKKPSKAQLDAAVKGAAKGEIPELCKPELQAALLLNGAKPESVSRLFGDLSNNDTVNSVPDRVVQTDMGNLAKAKAKMDANHDAHAGCSTKLGESIRHFRTPSQGSKPQ